jgi:hypothetical protein
VTHIDDDEADDAKDSDDSFPWSDGRTWQYARRLSVARASLGLCALEGHLLAVGGENRAMPNVPDQSPVYLASVEVYNRVRACLPLLTVTALDSPLFMTSPLLLAVSCTRGQTSGPSRPR